MRDRVGAAVEAVESGTPLDWNDLEAGTGPTDAGLVRQLRVIAAVAALHREDRESAGNAWGGLDIHERVGEGSFGEVYRAHDPRLARDVALKLLKHAAPPDSASIVVEEGRLLARVRHPNVITVHGAAIADGRAGIWMEFIDGQTLESMLQANGPLAAHEATAIGRILCGALAAVHGAGLVHGDVKAQNVMRERGGRLVLMDFGAGQELATKGTDGPLTGTPAYVAPELLCGARPDARSDLYSLGVLLFHLVTAAYPVQGRSRTEIRSAAASGARVRLRDLRSDLPEAFVSAVERAIAIDPRDRPASAGAMEQALASADHDPRQPSAAGRARPSASGRTVVAAVGVALIAGVAAALTSLAPWRKPAEAPAAAAVHERRLAILPVGNPSGDPHLDYVADGLTETLIRELSMVRGLRVTSRTSSMFFKGRRATIREIARQLDVDLAVESTLFDRGEDLEVELTLVDARVDRALWTRRFVETRSTPARLEASVALELLRRFGATHASESRPRDDEAYRWYLKGRYQWNKRTAEGMRDARQAFEEAIGADPTFALAHSGLAETYLLLGAFSWLPGAEAFPRAEAAAQHALELDPKLSVAHAVMGYLLTNRFEASAAYSEYLRAIELDPNNVTARQWYALSLMSVNPAEAVRQIEIARRLDPLSKIISSDAAVVYKHAGRWDEAIAQLEQTIAVYPDFAEGHVQLGNIYEQRRRPERAAAVLRRAIELGEDQAYVHASLVYNLAAAGDAAGARAALGRLEALARVTFVAPGALAIAYGGVGDRKMAHAYLAREASRDDLGKATSEAGRKPDLNWLITFAASAEFRSVSAAR